MNASPTASTLTEDSKPTLRLKALRPGRLQDPLLDAPVRTTPIRIYY